MRNTVTCRLRYLLYATLMCALTGCGAGNLANVARTDGIATGSVAAKTVLAPGALAKTAASAPTGVTSIQVTVTGTDNKGAAIPVVRGTFDASSDQGTIGGVYPGTVTLAVKAMNGSAVAYEGFAIGVVVNGGVVTTIADPIVLSPPLEKAQDQACIQCHETTLDSTGQNLVAEFKQSGHYSNSSWSDNVKYGIVGTGCAGCHGPAHNDVNPATGRCAECHVPTVTGSHSSPAFQGVCSNCHNSHDPFGPLAIGVPTAKYSTTATPYQPQQGVANYSSAPVGFNPVFTQLVVRHGCRGMSSFDASVWNMMQKASTDGALTPLGVQLQADIWKMMKANALLDYGVAGITSPGYGNLSQIGIKEQQQLASRLLQRLPGYFNQVAASKNGATPRQILYASSGVNRAIDSGGFYTQSLMANYSSLKPLIAKTAPLNANPANKPVAQAAGINRFLLYFHKLAAGTDLVTNSADPYYTTYTNSLLYQAYLKDANMVGKVNSILTTATAKDNARAVLLRLFTQDFVNKLDNGTYTFANFGTFTFTSDDGKYTATVSSTSTTPSIQSVTDAASGIYSYYVIAPEMAVELNNLDFTQYIPDAQASYLAYLDDVQSYYQKGFGISEDNPKTYVMAQILENDFFNEVDAIAKGNLSHGAVLRFTHAEEIIPFATILGLQVAATSTPNANTYTYDNNAWRGSSFGSGANVQWDVYGNGSGSLLVRMLYNEKETDFKPACDSARYAPGSHFYDYAGLKACYGHVAN